MKLLLITRFRRPELEAEHELRYHCVLGPDTAVRDLPEASWGTTEPDFLRDAEWADLIFEQEFADMNCYYAHLCAMLPRTKLRAVWFQDTLTRVGLHRIAVWAYHFVFVGQGRAAPLLAPLRAKVYWAPFCVCTDPRIVGAQYRMEGLPRDLPLVFAGTMNDPRDLYTVRNERLQALRDRYGERFHARQIFGEEYTRLWHRAQIGINMSVLDEMNIKNFEIPACGALLITNKNPEVQGIFQDGEHCLMYDADDPQSLFDAVDRALANPAERQRIARAGCEFVRANHHFGVRYHEMLTSIQERRAEAETIPVLCDQKPAPARQAVDEAWRELHQGLERLGAEFPDASSLARDAEHLRRRLSRDYHDVWLAEARAASPLASPGDS